VWGELHRSVFGSGLRFGRWRGRNRGCGFWGRRSWRGSGWRRRHPALRLLLGLALPPLPRGRADHRGRRRYTVGGTWARRAPGSRTWPRLALGRGWPPFHRDSRQADVGRQRRCLRRGKRAWQDVQRDRRGCHQPHDLADAAPSNSDSFHPDPSLKPGRFAPRVYLVARPWAALMSCNWSSTQSPGLREKMISFSPSDHSRRRSAGIVSAR
jgi:hypothetical protein